MHAAAINNNYYENLNILCKDSIDNFSFYYISLLTTDNYLARKDK